MNLFKMFFKRNKTEEMGEQKSSENEVVEDEYVNPKRDEVFYAQTTNDLNKMLKMVDVKTSIVNRHFLLQTIVGETYKLRDQENFKNLCLKYSEIHLAEFPEIANALKKDFEGVLPRVTVFQNYATLLSEISEFQKAISVCEMAISYGLSDGTKSDYQGRIERIRKKLK